MGSFGLGAALLRGVFSATGGTLGGDFRGGEGGGGATSFCGVAGFGSSFLEGEGVSFFSSGLASGLGGSGFGSGLASGFVIGLRMARSELVVCLTAGAAGLGGSGAVTGLAGDSFGLAGLTGAAVTLGGEVTGVALTGCSAGTGAGFGGVTAFTTGAGGFTGDSFAGEGLVGGGGGVA